MESRIYPLRRSNEAPKTPAGARTDASPIDTRGWREAEAGPGDGVVYFPIAATAVWLID